MQKNHRKYLIVGNWKMNGTSTEAVDLVEEIRDAVGLHTDLVVAICPPFTALESVARIIEDSNIQLGAQNMHPETNGAYTGEISAAMLRHLFCAYVIVGHSERRTYLQESDVFINQKVLAALESNLKPILCLGESLTERKSNETLSIVRKQLEAGLGGVEPDKAENLVIAYEPIWAIGTGNTATPEMAQEVHGAIRQMLAVKFDQPLASRIRILYGGSIKVENASALFDQPDIDGGLVGSASLDARSFIQLVEIAHEKV